MIDKVPELPTIKNIQVKLSEEEYEMFQDAAHEARMKPTAYARKIFVEKLQQERVRLGLLGAKRKHVSP